MSSKGLVLVTGVNGFIAARTVEAFINAGYSVRGTVRSASSGNGLLAALPEAAAQGRLEIVEVPDIAVPGAFDKAVQGGVTAVAHLASPVSFSFTNPEYVIGAAVKGSQSILESAIKETSIKHFVLVSSIAAIVDTEVKPFDHVYTEADWNDSSEAMIEKMGAQAPGRAIYGASKALGEKAFWKFREERKPKFTMTAINPVFVAGPPLVLPSLPEMINETTIFVWTVFSGQAFRDQSPRNFVDVRDVARLVRFGVDRSQEADGQRYIAHSGTGSDQSVADILRETYPGRRDTIKKGKPYSDYLPDFKAPPGVSKIDTTKATTATEQGWIDFKTMILDTAKAFEPYTNERIDGLQAPGNTVASKPATEFSVLCPTQ